MGHAEVERSLKLKMLVERTGYRIIQTNGQRIYSAPNADLPPAKGCEVFVGKIPRDMFEDELVQIFERIGPIYQLRLMMDFSGLNRGFAFVSYYTSEVADLAVVSLHEIPVRPGKRIGVYKSVDNCRLFVGGIPKHITKQEVCAGLAAYMDGIKEVIMYYSREDRSMNRGFVFVEFEDHRLAAMARRKLAPGSVIIWGNPILVDWADPLPDVSPNVMNKISKLYLRNLDVDATNQELMTFISIHLDMMKIIKLHKILDYAFVHFVRREDAEEALNILDGLFWRGNRLEVTWARPKFCSKVSRMSVVPEHFCTSLPPRVRKQVLRHKNEKLRQKSAFLVKNGGHELRCSSRNDSVCSSSSSTITLVPSPPASYSGPMHATYF